MIPDRPPREAPETPENWDLLHDSTEELGEPEVPATNPVEANGTPAMSVIAGSWGDLALILGLCAACLLALKIGGHGAPLAALPWALGLALAWWCAAAGVLVVVRQGTPGMLMAGLSFAQPVAHHRVPWVIVIAIVLCATLGIPAALSSRGWPLSMAAGTKVSTAAREAL
jgi:hypothetical protein